MSLLTLFGKEQERAGKKKCPEQGFRKKERKTDRKTKTHAPSSSSPSSRLQEQYVAGLSCCGHAKNTVGSLLFFSPLSVEREDPAIDLIAYPSSYGGNKYNIKKKRWQN